MEGLGGWGLEVAFVLPFDIILCILNLYLFLCFSLDKRLFRSEKNTMSVIDCLALKRTPRLPERTQVDCNCIETGFVLFSQVLHAL